MNTRNQYLADQLKPLIGGRITSIQFEECDWDNEDFPVLNILLPDGSKKALILQCDAEGFPAIYDAD
jgi:hypothetical protein